MEWYFTFDNGHKCVRLPEGVTPPQVGDIILLGDGEKTQKYHVKSREMHINIKQASHESPCYEIDAYGWAFTLKSCISGE